MQTDAELNEVFKKTAAQLTEPTKQSELEFLLIDNGLKTELIPKKIKRFMNGCGFHKKLIMREGVREQYWTCDSFSESAFSRKIRLNSFMVKFLQDKTSVTWEELRAELQAQKIDSDSWQAHFYFTNGVREGQARKWRGWQLVKADEGKIYKKVDLEGEKTE